MCQGSPRQPPCPPVSSHMAKIYYRERMQTESAQGKGMWRGVWRKAGTDFQEFSSIQSHGVYLSPPATRRDNTCEVLSAGEAH